MGMWDYDFCRREFGRGGTAIIIVAEILCFIGISGAILNGGPNAAGQVFGILAGFCIFVVMIWVLRRIAMSVFDGWVAAFHRLARKDRKKI
jgi:hypothetical protein